MVWLQGLSQLQSQEGHCPPAGTSLPSSLPSLGETSWDTGLPVTSLPKASLCIWPPCRLLGAGPGPNPDHAHPSILPGHFLRRNAGLRTLQPMDEEPEEPNQKQVRQESRTPSSWPRIPSLQRGLHTEFSSHKPTASLCCSQSLLAPGCPWHRQ